MQGVRLARGEIEGCQHCQRGRELTLRKRERELSMVIMSALRKGRVVVTCFYARVQVVLVTASSAIIHCVIIFLPL